MSPLATPLHERPKRRRRTSKYLQTLNFAGILYRTLFRYINGWRRERDSNPRTFWVNGFQDRRIRPLCHLSGAKIGWEKLTAKTLWLVGSGHVFAEICVLNVESSFSLLRLNNQYSTNKTQIIFNDSMHQFFNQRRLFT